MGWGSSFFPLLIITSSGGFTGLFEYSPAPGKGNLILSSTAANGTDPFGNAFFQGVATYAPSGGNSRVVDLLSTAPATLGFFQYANPSGGLQGSLILSVASAAGTDPVTAASYPAGMFGNDGLGNTITTAGATIQFFATPWTQTARINNFQAGTVVGFGPVTALTGGEQAPQLSPAHCALVLFGSTATKVAQFVFGAATGAVGLTPATQAFLEIQIGTMSLQNASAPASVSGWAEPFASSGHLDYVAGVAGDGNTYSTGRKTTFSNAIQTITSTTPATITGMSAPVSIGTYRAHGYVNGLQGGGTFATIVGFTGPATSLVAIMTRNYQIVNGATAEAQQPQVLTALGSVTTPAFTTPDAFGFEFDGIITFTAAGTFAVTGAQGSATHNWSSQPGSFLDLMPVA